MALIARITNVTYQTTETLPDGSTRTSDLSLVGRFQCTAQYEDDTNPGVVLAEQTFDFPTDIDTTEAKARIVAYAQHIRDARTRVGQLQSSVGAIIAVP